MPRGRMGTFDGRKKASGNCVMQVNELLQWESNHRLMRTYRLKMQDGHVITLSADRYELGASRDVVFFKGTRPIASFAEASILGVHSVRQSQGVAWNSGQIMTR